MVAARVPIRILIARISPPLVEKRLLQREAFLVALTYLVFGVAWILVSDRIALLAAGTDLALIERLQNAKGTLFIVLSTVVLYVAVSCAMRSRDRQAAERRRLEEMLRVAQKLEALGTLAATVVHDFNNVISIIRITATLAQQEHPASDALRLRLTEIDAAAARAQDTVSRLMLFLRKRATPMEPHDLGAIVRGFQPLLHQAVTSQVTLVVAAGQPLPSVACDAVMIEQALLNLVTNARDAVMDQPLRRISITVSQRTLAGYCSIFSSATREGEHVVIEVSDTGTGISAENHVMIFTPFFTTKPEGRGTGLGLASVWRTMEQHGGWVEVASQPGAGATFRLFFPVSSEQRPRSEPTSASSSLPVLEPGYARHSS